MRYRSSHWALQDVDLQLPAGSITALVGPNGAGKSTLMRIWVGFERPTSGIVRVNGRDPWRARAGALGQLGYVPQHPALYRRLSVTEHIELARHFRKGFDTDAALRRIDQLSIDPSQKAGNLSGGQQAQLGLVLAIGMRASVLLLDEPLASLDPLARRQFLGVVIDTARDLNATTLLSSHLVGDIEGVCDRLIVLGDGRVRLAATTEQARAEHAVVDVSRARDGHDGAVGFFDDLHGKPLALWRRDGLSRDRESIAKVPSLEEVILGYLASTTSVPHRSD